MKKLFNVDQLSVMILAGAIIALAWGCKREAVNVVADRVIEDVSQTLADGIYRTDEFTEKAISDYINIYDDIELTPCIYQTNYVIGDICQGKYIVTNGVIEEVVEEVVDTTERGVVDVETDIRWMEPSTPDGFTGSDFLGGTVFYDCRALFGFGTETNGTITNRIYGRLGIQKVDDRHVVIWEQVE